MLSHIIQLVCINISEKTWWIIHLAAKHRTVITICCLTDASGRCGPLAEVGGHPGRNIKQGVWVKWAVVLWCGSWVTCGCWLCWLCVGCCWDSMGAVWEHLCTATTLHRGHLQQVRHTHIIHQTFIWMVALYRSVLLPGQWKWSYFIARELSTYKYNL